MFSLVRLFLALDFVYVPVPLLKRVEQVGYFTKSSYSEQVAVYSAPSS